MKYLVMEIQKFENETMSTPTFSYGTLNAAEAKYHSILASAAVSKLPVHSAALFNETGYCIEHKSYNHSEPKPEPEPEEEAE